MREGPVTVYEYDFFFPEKATEYLHIFFIRIKANGDTGSI